jgi:NADH:ubiquinone oxidoreductase subunit 2 (subunit N)
MSKWQIMVAGAQTHNIGVILLVVFAALNSILSLGYYAPLVNRMYRHTPSATVEAGAKVSFVMTLPLVLLTVAIMILGIWPSLLGWLTHAAASGLLAAFGA